MLLTFAFTGGALPAPHRVPEFVAAAPSVAGNCTAYQTAATNCEQHCGSCFNPGARAGVLCKGSQTGYYCPSDNPPAGSDMTFACMDWTFGSAAMRAAEAAFAARSGEDVFFGVGTYGTADDAQRGLGACYRMHVGGVAKELIVQSVNTGSDVAGNQFDLQIGDGGAGAFNTCAGASTSMYPGSVEAWGHQYGGVDNRSQCAGLPPHPQVSAPMVAAGDDLVALCEYGFDQRVRGEGGTNPSILDLARVQCPPELFAFTQMHRSDDPAGYARTHQHRARAFRAGSGGAGAAAHKCGLDQPGGTAAWCLTRMMDCRKPSGAFKDNVKDSLMVPGMKLVQTCTNDGYTRIDVQCGCADCYC